MHWAEEALLDDDSPLFERATATGSKVRCTVCGATGYEGGSWQDRCTAGHPFPCGYCPKAFTTNHGAANHERTHR